MSETFPTRPARILDFRISVWGAIGTIGTFLFTSGGLYVKMQNTQATLLAIETKIDKRDAADEDMYHQIDHMTSRFDVFDMRITRNSQDISDLKSSVHDLNTAVTIGGSARK